MLHPPAISSCLEVEGKSSLLSLLAEQRPPVDSGRSSLVHLQTSSEEMKVERVLLKRRGFLKKSNLACPHYQSLTKARPQGETSVKLVLAIDGHQALYYRESAGSR